MAAPPNPFGKTVQQVAQEYADQEEEKKKQQAASGAQTPATPGTPMPGAANFDASDKTKAAQADAQAKLADADKTQNAISMGGSVPVFSPVVDRQKAGAQIDAVKAIEGDQAARGGVETADANTTASGVAGFLGGKDVTTHFTAGKVDDTTSVANAAKLNALADAAGARGKETMTGAQAGPVATGPQDATRARQNALLDTIGNAAMGGTGSPTAAAQMLKTGADRAQAAALARAAAAGTPGAQRQASFEGAAATQDAAGQAVALRAQEQQAAQGLAANTALGIRGQDLALSAQQQQTDLANAGLAQDAAKTNLLASIDQQKQMDALQQQYTAGAISLDQFKMQQELLQKQFNADLLARQSAADKGVGMQSAGQGGQLLGAGIGALGTATAALLK